MIHRMDPPEDPAYEPMPEQHPADARRAAARCRRDEEQFGFEVKWDGIRTVLYCDHGHCELQGRNGTRLHAALPGGARAGALARLAPDRARRRGRGPRRAGPAELRAAPVAHAPRLGLGRQAPHARHPRHLRDLRPALPRRPHDDGALATRSAASCSSSSSWRARPGARPPTTAARARRCSRPRAELGIEGVVAKRLDCPYEPGARASALDQGQERPHPGRGDRRLDARARAGAATSLGALAVGVMEDEQARLRRQGRHRLHRADARAPEARARAAAQRQLAVRGPPAAQGDHLRGAAPGGRTWSSASGRRAERSARPRSRACGRTSHRRNACARKVKSARGG